jgi:hypothetical protein
MPMETVAGATLACRQHQAQKRTNLGNAASYSVGKHLKPSRFSHVPHVSEVIERGEHLKMRRWRLCNPLWALDVRFGLPMKA